MKEEAEKEEAKPEVKKASSKQEVEEEDKREHVNIIFIGHVGKSFVLTITVLFLWNMSETNFIIVTQNRSKLILFIFSLDAGKSTIGGHVM